MLNDCCCCAKLSTWRHFYYGLFSVFTVFVYPLANRKSHYSETILQFCAYLSFQIILLGIIKHEINVYGWIEQIRKVNRCSRQCSTLISVLKVSRIQLISAYFSNDIRCIIEIEKFTLWNSVVNDIPCERCERWQINMAQTNNVTNSIKQIYLPSDRQKAGHSFASL